MVLKFYLDRLVRPKDPNNLTKQEAIAEVLIGTYLLNIVLSRITDVVNNLDESNAKEYN